MSGTPRSRTNASMLAMNRLVIGSISAEEAKRVAEVLPEEAHNPHLVLELGDVAIEVHPIDPLDLQCHVLAQDFRHTACYTHFRLRFADGCPTWTTHRLGGFMIGGRFYRTPFSHRNRSLSFCSQPTSPYNSSGWGEAP